MAFGGCIKHRLRYLDGSPGRWSLGGRSFLWGGTPCGKPATKKTLARSEPKQTAHQQHANPLPGDPASDPSEAPGAELEVDVAKEQIPPGLREALAHVPASGVHDELVVPENSGSSEKGNPEVGFGIWFKETRLNS